MKKVLLIMVMIMSFVGASVTTEAATTHYCVDTYTDVAGNEIILRPIDVYEVNGLHYVDLMNLSQLGIHFTPTNVGAEVDIEMVDGTIKKYTWNNLVKTCTLTYSELSYPFVDDEPLERVLSTTPVDMEYDIIVNRTSVYVPLECLMKYFNMSYDPYAELEAYPETYNADLKCCPSQTVLVYPNEYYYTEKANIPNKLEYKSKSEFTGKINKEVPDTSHKEVKLICDECVAYGVVIDYINDDYAKVAWYGISDKEGNEISEHDYPTYMNDAYKYGFRIDATTVIEISRLS